MKRNFLVFCLLVATLSALAYPFDVIITKSREQVQCIIISRTEEQITYHQVNDNSQSFTISTKEVEKVYSRDNGPIISYVPEPEPVAVVATKEVEVLIAEKPEPIIEKKVEPEILTQNVAVESAPTPFTKDTTVAETTKVEPRPEHIEKTKTFTEDELNFKRFMSTINGPDMKKYREAKAEAAQKEEVLSQNIISIFVTGLNDNQTDIQQILESEILSKLSTIEGHKAKVEVAPKKLLEDSITVIAKNHLSKYALIISARPFQKQYYLQSKLIGTTNGELLVSASAASSLTSLEDVLKVAEELTSPIGELLHKEKEKEVDTELQAWIEESDKQAAKKQEKEQSIYDDTFILEIVNMKNYQCRVLVAGRLVGIANPWSTQRFRVSLDLYGKVQIIQNTGYQFYPAETTYYIPRQSSQAVLTLSMD